MALFNTLMKIKFFGHTVNKGTLSRRSRHASQNVILNHNYKGVYFCQLGLSFQHYKPILIGIEQIPIFQWEHVGIDGNQWESRLGLFHLRQPLVVLTKEHQYPSVPKDFHRFPFSVIGICSIPINIGLQCSEFSRRFPAHKLSVLQNREHFLSHFFLFYSILSSESGYPLSHSVILQQTRQIRLFPWSLFDQFPTK